MKPQTATRRALKRILALAPVLGWTTRYPNLNRLEKSKMSVLCRKLMSSTGNMVFAGPFSTMKLDETLALSWDPKMIVGSYEQEVHDVINEVICSAPANIIDIGAAYGYYAVGLALKIANTTVTAFEGVEDPHWRELANLARLNGVSDKIIQRGFCTTEELAKTCRPGSFILCDCEGGELEILKPSEISNLRSCKILVELHEFNRPHLIAALVTRFRDSHHMRIIEELDRNPSQYRILKTLPRSWRTVAVEETKWVPSVLSESSRTTTWLRFMVLDPN